MKKIIILLLAVVMCFVVACVDRSNDSEIRELEESIEEYEEALEDWQATYDKALAVYNQYKYSSDYEIQKELERTKAVMDEAKRNIAELERKIMVAESLLEAKRD